MANYPSAEYFKDFLRKIYPCKEPFELLVVDKKPKTRAGVYIYGTHRIRIYAPWGHLEETAIHELIIFIIRNVGQRLMENVPMGRNFGKFMER
jgi:hypothetical protein